MGKFPRHSTLCRLDARMTAVLLGLALTGCSMKPAVSSAPPKVTVSHNSSLVCEKPIRDVGEVLVKDKPIDFEHAFLVKNRSNATVKIREVRTDCGCIVPEAHAELLGPGEATEIKATISVFGPPGPFRKTIVVQDESGEILTLSFAGNRAVSDMLCATPPKMNFGTMTRGETKTSLLIVSRYDGSPVNFRALVAEQGSRVRLDGQPRVFEREDVILHKRCQCVELPIRLDLDSPLVGPFKTKLTIQTNAADPRASELNVELEATIVEPKTPWLPSIFVNRLGPGESVERSITNESEDADRLNVVANYEGDSTIQVHLVHASPGGKGDTRPAVKISRSPDFSASGLARGTLILRTPDTGETVARISIVAFLSK